MGLEFLNHRSDKTFPPEVVVRRPHEVRAIRFFKHPLKVCNDSDIGVVETQLDSRVPGRVLLTDLSRAVGGSIVRNDYFKIVVVLREKAVERARKISLSVVNGQADADQWIANCHVLFSRTLLQVDPQTHHVNSDNRINPVKPSFVQVIFTGLQNST